MKSEEKEGPNDSQKNDSVWQTIYKGVKLVKNAVRNAIIELFVQYTDPFLLDKEGEGQDVQSKDQSQPVGANQENISSRDKLSQLIKRARSSRKFSQPPKQPQQQTLTTSDAHMLKRAGSQAVPQLKPQHPLHQQQPQTQPQADSQVRAQGEPEQQHKKTFMVYFLLFIRTHFQKVIALIFLFCFLANGDILSLIYPLSYFLYAGLEYPFPPVSYWNLMIYEVVIVISVKFLYQLPFFCGTNPLQILMVTTNTCSDAFVPRSELIRRWDYVLGLKK